MTPLPDQRAIIVGAAGQDGSLLYELLAQRGYGLVGLERTGVRVSHLEWSDPIDLSDSSAVARLVQTVTPTEIYYVAAFHHSSEDAPMEPGELFARSHDVHVSGLLSCLEAARRHAPQARIFYAASSHVFGEPETAIQNETTPIRPTSIYGLTKAAGMHLCRFYRTNYDVQTSVGILYNHESPRRGPSFLSKKIVAAAVKIGRGEQQQLALGRLSARSDWGYAPEYVDAMTRILSLPYGDDFILATGISHTVQDFAAAVFGALDLDWQRYVVEEPRILSRQPPVAMPFVGDPRKLEHATGWRAQTDLSQLARYLVAAEINATPS